MPSELLPRASAHVGFRPQVAMAHSGVRLVFRSNAGALRLRAQARCCSPPWLRCAAHNPACRLPRRTGTKLGSEPWQARADHMECAYDLRCDGELLGTVVEPAAAPIPGGKPR